MATIELEAVRNVNPVPDPAAVVDPAVRDLALRRALRAPDEVAPSTPATPWWRRRARLPLLAVFGPLVVTAAALAASGILFGSAYNPPWGKRAPSTDVGVPVAGSVRLLPLRVADAAGGPPWGMRVLRTTRGYECVQVGRVVDGRLGVIGQDGWFGDDHRFHPMPPSNFSDGDCGVLGTGGYALIGSWDGIFASGIDLVGKCAYPGPQGPGNHMPVCPTRDLRFIAYGLVGPAARSITYALGGRRSTIFTVGSVGAYLVVRGERKVLSVRGAGGGGPGMAGGGGPGSFPGSIAIHYADGHSCPSADPPGTDACAYAGFILPGDRALHLRRVRVHVSPPRRDPMWHDEMEVLLRFRAPLTITTGALDYAFEARNPGVGVATVAGSLGRDVRKGSLVTWPVDIPDCTSHVVLKLYVGRTNPRSEPWLAPMTPVGTLATLRIRVSTAHRPAWCSGP